MPPLIKQSINLKINIAIIDCGTLNSSNIAGFDQRVVKNSILQKKLKGSNQCNTCQRRCSILEGKRGFCGTRINQDGVLKTLVYGNVSSISNNPIEKKPFFHFAPSTKALTVGTWGCNATCGFCQNYEISKQHPTPQNSRYVSPKSFVNLALKRGSQGVSISFNEAATLMLEWNIEVFELAHKEGLYNTIVTNGYMTPEALGLLIDAGLDAANVDIKGCGKAVEKHCGLRVEDIWSNVAEMKRQGVHVELTTLLVPGLSYDLECLKSASKRIVEELGPSTPWHVNRYFPHYQYREPKTPLELLLKAREIGREDGLHFVYIGNVLEKGFEDTNCPSCGRVCYERLGFRVANIGADSEGRCKQCSTHLSIRYWP